MTFEKLGYVYFKPKNYDNFVTELTAIIINILGEDYYDCLSTHTDGAEDIELWLKFSKEDINYKKLIGHLITQKEYDALVENNATTILFY